jgi:ABC-2 type transport system ATP-binding protein
MVCPMRVDLRQLGKTYDGDAWAVRGLELSIPTGSIYGLIGPNGAGKSTALRMIATVMEPTEGHVAYDGIHAASGESLGSTEIRRRIGFLGDGNPLYKHTTPVEYLRLFGQCFRIPGAQLEPAIEEVLDTFDLRGKADTPAGALSKGMRQRLLIARCLLHRPDLLILDEPADGLDPRGRSDLRRILLSVKARGVTVLISSHILRELDDLCDRVAILQRGRVLVEGEVDEIIDRYEVSRFVYQLRLLDGLDTARALLAKRRVLVESESIVEDRPTLTLQVQGGEPMVAQLVAELCAAGVRIVTLARVRSRLEDVYDRLSEDRVN